MRNGITTRLLPTALIVLQTRELCTQSVEEEKVTCVMVTKGIGGIQDNDADLPKKTTVWRAAKSVRIKFIPIHQTIEKTGIMSC